MSTAEREIIIKEGGLQNFIDDQQWAETRLTFAAAFDRRYDEGSVSLGAPNAIDKLKTIRGRKISMEALRQSISVKRSISAIVDGSSPTAALDALVATWKRKANPRSPKTVKKMELIVRRFTGAVGSRVPRDIIRADIIRFRESLEAKTDLSQAAVQQHLSFLHRLFGVALSENLIDANPVHGVKAIKPAGAKFSDDDGRKPFEPMQVRAIFKAMEKESTDTQWIIRLLAYHGMRSGEVAQLRCEDVAVVSGIPVLRIHDKYGSIKNKFSKRDIPIHPECMGVVAYAAARGSEPWLFQSYAKTVDKGGKFQRWGGNFLRSKVGIADTDLTMHSLRHTWKTCARELGMPAPVSRAIMGHSMGSGHHEGYGAIPSLRSRADWIAKINPVA